MKFYEFNNSGYYALICAISQEEALKYYGEMVSDIDEDDRIPDEITEMKAIVKLLAACEGNLVEYNETVNQLQKSKDDMKPYLVLIDSCLT